MLKRIFITLSLTLCITNANAAELDIEMFSNDELNYIESVYKRGANMVLNNNVSVKQHFCPNKLGFESRICVVSNLEMLTYFGDVCRRLDRELDNSCPGQMNIGLTAIIEAYMKRPDAGETITDCLIGNSQEVKGNPYDFVVLPRTGGTFSSTIFAKPRNLFATKECIGKTLNMNFEVDKPMPSGGSLGVPNFSSMQ